MAAAVSKSTIKSYSKVNLYLEVVNQRKDGYHNLRTLFARINLTDSIFLKTRLDDNLIKIKCNHPRVPLDQRNLCFRSARLLQQEFNLKQGLEISINKRVPVAAGLGGGSGNAAAVLRGLNKLWGLKLSTKKLVALAKQIGSDVAFFIYQEKFAQGFLRGDKIRLLKQLKSLKLWFVIILPGINVSTPLIFRQWDKYSSKKQPGKNGILRKNSRLTGLTIPEHDVKMLTSELKVRGRNVRPEFLFNGLEPVTTQLYPEARRAKSALINEGLNRVLMSGSGPAVFAICSSRIQAKRISKKIQNKYTTWQVYCVSSI
ncbi:MAG: 4-(cytidine 5'-diphospho)-2-C-methyl-D-erythritol kinase [Candidatus Omnitrophica bacterium]|jgi:4-diphosphocytidyl-2C-methyl-D-erythritol kinase|nr:4-(cytidine 5'-diphospho)-2-C-methyl-D-erythritol kinase [Candidatus Omnitrophota bacterium]